MHEFGIAESILKTALEVSQSNGGKVIERVYVQVGGLRLIVPEMLIFAFEALAADTEAHGAQLECEEIPARIRCAGCATEFAPEGPFWSCPACSRNGGELIAGDELVLRSVVLRDDALPDAKVGG